MPPILTRKGDALELSLAGCRGSEFMDAKDKIKKIPASRFDWDTKLWVVPGTVQNAERILKSLRPDAEQDVLDWITESKMSSEDALTQPIAEDADDLLIPWAKKRMPWQPEEVNDEKFDGLLPMQRAGVSEMVAQQRVILGDEMGLGKTLQAISAVEEFRERHGGMDGAKLVICPSSVKGSWERELRRWLPPDTPIRIILGSYPTTKAGTGDEKRKAALREAIDAEAWIIVNWEQLRVKKEKVKMRNGGTKTVINMKEPLFETTEWLAVIADEVHRAKNRKAQQSQGLYRVQTKVGVQFGLTGTPVQNSPDELWSILRWLWPDQFGSSLPASKKNPAGVPKTAYWAFYEDYVDYWEDHYGKKIITGVKNPDALRFLLQGKLIRRTSGRDGRKRIYEDVPLNPGQQKLYDEAEKVMWLAVQKEVAAGNKDAIAFARAASEAQTPYSLFQIQNGASRLVRLRQIIENAALLGGSDDSALMDRFEQKYEDSRPYQWTVFCQFKESCDLLAERLRSKYGAVCGIYTGDVHPGDRTKLEDEYQKGDIDVMIGTIDAMKEGITLTSGHLQYWLSRSFVPSVNEQGEARSDRIGQQKTVLVYIPQGVRTVSTSKVDPINRLKEQIVSAIYLTDDIKEVRA